ncbi:MAG: hypothetical protein ACK43J_08470 [Chitinophagaceae bacterium]|jgi:hypothetical protein
MSKRLFIVFLVLMASCGKESIRSKPQLRIKSVSSTVVPVGKDLQVTLRLSDKEGDFVDTLWIKKRTSNCGLSNFSDSVLYRIPEETPRIKNFDADVLVTFSYAIELQPRCGKSDTAIFSFWIRDYAGNSSDTVTTSPIIIQRL